MHSPEQVASMLLATTETTAQHAGSYGMLHSNRMLQGMSAKTCRATGRKIG
jgi:hypothetical protein